MNALAVEPPLGTTRPWIGKVFMVLGTLWFAGVFWVMRPDHEHVDPRPRPTVVLQDGKTYRVYLPSEILGAETDWVEKIDFKTEYTYWDFMRRPLIRFLLISMGPPAAILFGSLAWLGIVELVALRRFAGRYRD